MEKTVSIAKAFTFGGSGSIAVIIPKKLREELNIKKGNRYLVKKDCVGRIIYEPL
jgi:antitoxin component of MazEF toxin-antitoxin module